MSERIEDLIMLRIDRLEARVKSLEESLAAHSTLILRTTRLTARLSGMNDDELAAEEAKALREHGLS